VNIEKLSEDKPGLMKTAIGLLRAMRPKQWTKNLLVFAALIFAQRLDDPRATSSALVTFVLFCLLSSSVYLVNDVMDIDEDRQHPVKRHRPLASGLVSPALALVLAAGLGPVGVIGCFLINFSTGLVAVSYLALTLAYTLWLKRILIIDVLAVAIGYVLRAVVGATAIRVEISPWLLICTVLLALFLVLCKRRQELVMLEENAAQHRAILGEYSSYLLDQMIGVVTASIFMSYCLYTISERTVQELGTKNLMYTIPFVIYGIFRYLYLVHQKNRGDAPDQVLLTDGPLLVNVVLYVAAVVLVLYLSGG